MPKISEFYGISIYMYFLDHDPAHFHVKYSEYEAKFEIQNFQILSGNLPKTALRHVLEWAFEHRNELLENWERVQHGQKPKTIKPLE